MNTTIADYLKDGTLPARKAGSGADKVCAPIPAPTPGKSASGDSGSEASRATQALLRGGTLR